MSMYKQFKTNPDLEVGGILLEYTDPDGEDFRVTIARAGGANKKYAKVLEARAKPYRRAIQMEMMDNQRVLLILKRVYAETVVLNWETKNADDEFVKGIENPEGGSLLPVTVDNVEKTFLQLNDLFLDVKEQAERSVLFRQTIQEEEAKN